MAEYSADLVAGKDIGGYGGGKQTRSAHVD